MKQQKQPTSFPIDGFIPPQAVELEEIILGAVLIESNAFDEASEIIDADDFYNPAHQTIFSAITDLNKNRQPIDMFTVTEELRRNNTLDEIGGAYYITLLTAKVSSAAHLEYHCQVIKQKSVERKVIETAQQAIREVFNSEDIGDVIFSLSKKLEAAQESLIGKNDTSHISSSVGKSLEDMYKRKQRADKGQSTGVNTGIKDLDRLTNGWQRSELVVIAARPAMGKTALCLHFAKSAAKTGTPVAMFSLEMSDVSLANRLLLSECDVDADKFKSGYLNSNELAEAEKAATIIADYPIYVDDNPSVTMSYIRAKSRVLKKQGKCEMVVIDYLQLAGESKEKNRNREQEIAQMSREAKIIAKELEIPVLLLSQLNRGVEGRTDKRPLLSDLRESGAIEQDADIVMFIHRPQYYKIEVSNGRGEVEINYGELIIAKNRNGATGLAKFKHNDSMTKIHDYSTSYMPF